MNALDFALIISLLILIGTHKFFSGSVVIVTGTCLAVGFAFGWLIASGAAPHFSKDLHKGLVAGFIVLSCCIVSFRLGKFAGERLKTKLLVGPWAIIDKKLTIPSILVSFVFALWILGSTLVHLPVTGLQFMVQGSALMITTDRFTPHAPLANVAKKIAPQQHSNRILDYDAAPLTYSGVNQAGKFAFTARFAADSVIKVSGRSCTGLWSGSGFVVSPGLIATSAHVVVGSSTIYVRAHGSTYPATPLVVDTDYDIAILRSVFLAQKPLELNTAEAAIGSGVVAMGYPRAGDLRANSGRIIGFPSSFRQDKIGSTKLDATNTHIFDAQVEPGNSGGPLLNAQGEVIGVVSAVADNRAIAVRSSVLTGLIKKAKNKFTSTNTGDCSVYSNYKGGQ